MFPGFLKKKGKEGEDVHTGKRGRGHTGKRGRGHTGQEGVGGRKGKTKENVELICLLLRVCVRNDQAFVIFVIG